MKNQIVKQAQANLNMSRELPHKNPTTYQEKYENQKKANEIRNITKNKSFQSFFFDEVSHTSRKPIMWSIGRQQQKNKSFEGVLIKPPKNSNQNNVTPNKPKKNDNEQTLKKYKTSAFIYGGEQKNYFNQLHSEYQCSLDLDLKYGEKKYLESIQNANERIRLLYRMISLAQKNDL